MIASTTTSGIPSSRRTVSRSVPSVMKATVPHAGGDQEILPPVIVPVWDQRPTRRGGEDVALVLPCLLGILTFPHLLLLVLAEKLDHRLRQSDGPASSTRLSVLELTSGLATLRAVPRLTAAGVGAAVLVLRTQPVLPGAEVPGIQVNVFPLKSQRFALPKPERERERDDSAGAVPEL
ncbi:hypothetical protein ACWEIK_02560 [Streptomyces sp. NPDC004673]